MSIEKQKSIKDLQSLKNIGKTTAERLYSLGIRSSEEMKRSDPKKLYEKLKKKSGNKLDKCVLYQFQGAISNKSWWRCNR